MFKKNFLVFVLIFFSLQIFGMQEKENNKVVIFIHGLASPGIIDPFIDFFKTTQKLSSININNPGKFGSYLLSLNKNNYIYATHAFSWDRKTKGDSGGILSKKGRYEAAQYLYKHLTTNSDFANKEISIVAHSHGGNVATELLRVIGKEKSQLKIKNLIFYETPKGKITEEGIHTQVNNSYVAENVFDVNLNYQPDYSQQQKQKATQVIDIFHQFPRCFRTSLKKRDNLHDILLDGMLLNHNSILYFKDLVRDLLDNDKIEESYKYWACSQDSFTAKTIHSFHANNPIFQYFCYYIFPYIIKSIQVVIFYKLLMRYDKKYNLRIKENLINKINLLINKYRSHS